MLFTDCPILNSRSLPGVMGRLVELVVDFRLFDGDVGEGGGKVLYVGVLGPLDLLLPL